MNNIELKINLMKEQGLPHPPQEEEQEFYRMVTNGDTEGIAALKARYSDIETESSEKGKLSDNPVRNEIYHLVANCTIITRKCIEAGMPQEDAFSLSDMFIRQADKCHTVEEVHAVNDEMAAEFAQRMKKLRAKAYSRGVNAAVKYISDNLHTRLTAAAVAEKAGYERSYFSALFHRETGMTLTQYILVRRIETAASLISGGIALSQTAALVGFSSQSHFCKRFKEITGITPGEYKNRLT